MDELLLNLRISLVIGNRFRLGVLIKVPLTPDDNSTEFPSITPLNRTKIKPDQFSSYKF